MPLVSTVVGAASADAATMAAMSGSTKGSPPVTKISFTPRSRASLGDPADALEPERPAGRLRRRAHTAIGAFADCSRNSCRARAARRRSGRPRALSGASPRRMTCLNRPASADRTDQAVAREPAPGLEIRQEARIGADDGKRLPVPALADRRDQPGKQAVGEGHGADVDLEFRLHGRPAVTVRLRRRGSTVTRPLRRAGAALHEKSPQDCRKL